MPSLEYRNEIRREMGKQSRFVLLFVLVLAVGTPLSLLALNAAELVPSDTFYDDHRGEFGVAALAVFMLIAVLKLRGRFLPSLRSPEPVPHRMKPRMLISCLLMFFCAQSLILAVTFCIDGISEALGFSTFNPSRATDVLDVAEPALWLILYTSILGPIVEEIVFRGIVMGSLARFGQTFAIVASAALFGLAHADVVQGLFAFCTGLILGFVAMRYSLGWAIGLHIFNNLLISDWLSNMIETLPLSSQDILNATLFVVSVGSTVFILLRHREDIKRFLVEHRSRSGTVKAAFTTPSFLVFVGLQIVLCGMTLASQ